MERLCVFCKYFNIDMGWCGTAMTPGESTVIECEKNHWRMENGDGPNAYRENIIKAVNCKDFESHELLK